MPTLVALIVGSTFMVLTPGIMMGRMMSTLRSAEERAFVHMQQLLPSEARAKGEGAGKAPSPAPRAPGDL